MDVNKLFLLARYLQSLQIGWYDIIEMTHNKIVLIERYGKRPNWKVMIIEFNNVGLILNTITKTWAETNDVYLDPVGEDLLRRGNTIRNELADLLPEREYLRNQALIEEQIDELLDTNQMIQSTINEQEAAEEIDDELQRNDDFFDNL